MRASVGVASAFQSHACPRACSSSFLLQRIAAGLARDVAQMSTVVLGAWTGMSETTLWKELASCILGSQVSNAQMRTTLTHLESDGLAEPWNSPGGLELLEARFSFSLAPRPRTEAQPRRVGYRFPHRGASLLARAVKAVYGSGTSIRELLGTSADGASLRRALVNRIPGIGPKQASLFLLEIGVSDDMVSLDRHLLRYLALTRDISTGKASFVVTPSSLTVYDRLESELRSEAHAIGVTLASMDTAVWVLMRAWSAYTESIQRNINAGVV